MERRKTEAIADEDGEEARRKLTWRELEDLVFDQEVRNVESLDPERSIVGPLHYTKFQEDVIIFHRLWSAAQVMQRGWYHCYEDVVTVPKSSSEAHLTVRNTIEIRPPLSAGLIILHLRRGFELSPHDVANFPAARLPGHLIN